MNHSLEYQDEQFKQLYQLLVNSTQNILSQEKLVIDLQKAVSVFSKQLQTIGERFHEQINSGSGDNDTIVCSQQQLSNYLLRIGQNWNTVGDQLQTEVIEPFQQFIANFRATNRQAVADGKSNLKEMEYTRDQMARAQQDYWRLMASAQRGTQAVENIVDAVDKGSKTKEDFQKLFDRSYKLRQVSDEAEQDYKKLVEITNKKWEAFDKKQQEVFKQSDLNDESRIQFSKQNIFQTIKLFTTFQENDQPMFPYYEEKFKEIEQRGKEESKIQLKKYVEKLLEKKGVQPVHYRKEEFISYDQWRQINDEKDISRISSDSSMMSQTSGSWILVGEIITDDERTQIDQYIEILLIPDNQKQVEPPKSLELKEQSSLQEEQTAFYKNQQQSLQSSQDAINLKYILQKQTARFYFTDTLSRRYHKTNRKQYIFTTFVDYYLYLNEEKFNDLVHIVRHWLKYTDLNEAYDCEEMYKLLQLSSKVIKNTAHNKTNLAASLSDMDIWQKVSRWQQLYQYICSKKIEEKRKKAQMLRSNQNQGVIRKSIGILGKFSKLISGQSEKTNINESEVVYLILEELNLFLISLQLSSQISADVILTLALQQDSVNLEKEMLVKLLEKQENRNNSLLRRQLTSSKYIKEQKEMKYEKYGLAKYEFKAIYAIQISLQFFSINDRPEQLLLVSKDFSQRLQRKIGKFYLLHPTILYSEKNEKLRNSFIIKFFKLDQCDIDYIQMKIQVGIDSNIHMSGIEEVITLDVHRSLHIHQSKISSSILQSLLRTYAYFNPDVSYAQGMNYIAGYLYLTFGDEEITYKTFHFIMLDYFRQILVSDFKQLKQMFYQFDRMFSVFLPELCEHFKQEKVDPSYYAASWFITLFSSVFQYSMRSAFLNIIWDLFITESWKGFYKVTFFILSLLQPKLIKMEFEDILQLLGEVVRSELFQIENEEQLINYIRELQGKPIIENPTVSIKGEMRSKFKITNNLIRKLEIEYHHFILNFDNKLKNYQK